MVFIKGHTIRNTGRTRFSKINQINRNSFPKGNQLSKIYWKGKHHSPKTIEKLRKINMGNMHGWKGGKYINEFGYVLIYTVNHHTGRKYVPEHRLVMEKHIKRNLLSSEQIHHINQIRNDNRIENLMIVSNSKHNQLHPRNVKRDKKTGRFLKNN